MKKNHADNPVLSVACPQCGAAKHEVCRASSGKKVPNVHSARIQAHTEAEKRRAKRRAKKAKKPAPAKTKKSKKPEPTPQPAPTPITEVVVPSYSKRGAVTLPATEKEMVAYISRAMLRRITPDVKRFAALVVEKGWEHASMKPLCETLATMGDAVSSAKPGTPVPPVLRAPKARLKIGGEEQIAALLNRYQEGATYKQLEEEFQISRGVIWRTLNANNATRTRPKKSERRAAAAARPVGGKPVTGRDDDDDDDDDDPTKKPASAAVDAAFDAPGDDAAPW